MEDHWEHDQGNQRSTADTTAERIRRTESVHLLWPLAGIVWDLDDKCFACTTAFYLLRSLTLSTNNPFGGQVC
jgi:hypothetical protein